VGVKSPKSGMSTVTFKLSDEYVKAIDELVDEGVFISRSEALRTAVRLLVERYQSGFTQHEEHREEQSDS